MGGGAKKRRKNSAWWKGSGLCKRARGPRQEIVETNEGDEQVDLEETARLQQAAREARDGEWDDDQDEEAIAVGEGSASVFEGYYRAQGLLERSTFLLSIVCAFIYYKCVPERRIAWRE